MPKLINIKTHRGGFNIAPDQIAGCKPAILTDNATGAQIEGTEILISLGAIPMPMPAALRWLAEQLEEARRPALVLPVNADALPPKGPRGPKSL